MCACNTIMYTELNSAPELRPGYYSVSIIHTFNCLFGLNIILSILLRASANTCDRRTIMSNRELLEMFDRKCLTTSVTFLYIHNYI